MWVDPPAQSCSLNTALRPGQLQVIQGKTYRPIFPCSAVPSWSGNSRERAAGSSLALHRGHGWGTGAGTQASSSEKGYVFISSTPCLIQEDSVNSSNVLTPSEGVSNISRLNAAHVQLGLLASVYGFYSSK